MQRVSLVLAFLLVVSVLASCQTSTPGAQDAAPNHPKGEYATVSGARLWYESEGTGEPLILISGALVAPLSFFISVHVAVGKQCIKRDQVRFHECRDPAILDIQQG